MFKQKPVLCKVVYFWQHAHLSMSLTPHNLTEMLFSSDSRDNMLTEVFFPRTVVSFYVFVFSEINVNMHLQINRLRQVTRLVRSSIIVSIQSTRRPNLKNVVGARTSFQ